MRSLRLPIVLAGFLAAHAGSAAEEQVAANAEAAEALAAGPKPLFTQDRDNYFLFIGPGSERSTAHRVRFQLSINMVDYAVGYGETLLRYNDYQGSTLRFGLTLDDLLSTESSAGGDG